ERTANNPAALDALLLIVAAKDHDVAGEEGVGPGDLAYACTATLLHAVAGVEILLLDQVVHLGPLDYDNLVGLGQTGHQHCADALADVLLGAEHSLHRGHDSGIV